MRIFAGLAAIVLLAGCQTTSHYAGSGDVTLSARSAFAAEKFLKNPDASAMAITLGGGGFGTATCQSTSCAWREGSAEKMALALCERRGDSCAVFAVNHSIVWNGNVRLPVSDSDEYVLRIVEQVEPHRTTTTTGKARRDPATGEYLFDVYFKGYSCDGGTNQQGGTWALDCRDQVNLSGTLGSAGESIIWGQSESRRFTISIQDSGFPVLREKLAARVESAARAEPKTVASRGTIVPPNYNASLAWPGQDGQVWGKISRVGLSNNGTLSFASKDQKVKCDGSMEIWYGTTGSWSLKCENGQQANGSLRVDGDFVSGEGETPDGESVTFISLR